MSRKIPLGTALAVLFIVMAATIAITMKVSMNVYNNLISDLADRSATYDSLAEVDEIAREDYFGSISSDELEAGIAAGYIAGLGDEASFYLTADEYTIYNNKLLGKMSGTGITCTYNTETEHLYITGVAKNSPAETAGIVAGDEITKIDDTAINDDNYEDMMASLEGKKLTNVNVTYLHESSESTVNLVMGYSASSVTYHSVGSVGIISINAFYENSVNQFEDAIDALTDAGAKALVIDVRNCSEGTIAYATEMLDILVPVATDGTGAMASIVDKDGKTTKTYPSDSDCVTLPMMVLVNGGTSGPAELFACDLRDFGKAQLIGTKTKGICTKQDVYQLSDGGAVVLTTANVLPYKSDNYNGVGITPDYIVKLSAEETAQIGIMSDADDPHIQKAIELLAVEE